MKRRYIRCWPSLHVALKHLTVANSSIGHRIGPPWCRPREHPPAVPMAYLDENSPEGLLLSR